MGQEAAVAARCGGEAMIPYAKIPCAECPWRRDVPPGKFPPERYVALAHTAYDMAVTVFACHMSHDDHAFACAGFLLRAGGHNLIVRLSQQAFADLRSPYPLYGDYRALAVANGVDPDHPSLRPCRLDGARR